MKLYWKKIDKFTAIAYFFIHFSVEVLCFYVLGSLFTEFAGDKWIAYLVFDAVAFTTQPFIGTLAEAHPKLRIGIPGSVLLLTGAALALIFRTDFVPKLLGIVLFTLGNACLHISGALATGRASEGRLSEPAIFVGGGSFGVITGSILASKEAPFWVAFIPAAVSVFLVIATDRRLRNRYGDRTFDFAAVPVKHNIVRERSAFLTVIIMFLIVVARGYIGYGIPTGWKTLDVHTVLLFVFMGIGKVLGGVLSDLFGAGKVGFVSCIVALPVLLLSDGYMWPSLVGIALFSMTMAITLGGLFSVMKYTPGVAFGVTTVALFIGSLPVFFSALPSQQVCNILNVVMSVLSFVGILYCIKGEKKIKEEDL